MSQFLNLPRDAAVGAGGAAAGAAIQDRAQQRPATGDRAGTARDNAAQRQEQRGQSPGDRRDQARQGAQDRREQRPADRQERTQQRHERGQHVRDNFRDHHPRYDFWKDNPHWARWRFTRPYRWATWGALTGWFGWGGGSGTYYDYGGDYYYDDGYVYHGDEQVATTEEYAEQAMALADTGAETLDSAVAQQAGEEMEWMSLGVFGLADAEDGDAIMFLQLAVNKDGIIAGTYHNMVTDQSLPVQGSVDRESQRAAWSIGDNKNTVMETGIFNLTEDETPLLVHFGTGKTQNWLMVRMDEPESEAPPSS